MENVIGPLDLSDEYWREYEFAEAGTYRIDAPVSLYFRQGGTTHRIVDASGVVHCVPAPGQRGCVLRWKPRDSNKPVQF